MIRRVIARKIRNVAPFLEIISRYSVAHSLVDMNINAHISNATHQLRTEIKSDLHYRSLQHDKV